MTLDRIYEDVLDALREGEDMSDIQDAVRDAVFAFNTTGEDSE